MNESNSQQNLYSEETIAILRDIRKGINRQTIKEVDIRIDTPELLKGISDAIATPKPTINVEPTPVMVEHHDSLILDNSALENILKEVQKDIKSNKVVEVSNPTKAVDSITVKNMTVVEKLLKQILKKEAVINVNTKAPAVSVSFPTSTNPKEYIPVRLTDGTQFYNAMSSLVTAMNKGAGGFSGDDNITTVINGDIITETNGIRTKTTTISGDTITEVWS